MKSDLYDWIKEDDLTLIPSNKQIIVYLKEYHVPQLGKLLGWFDDGGWRLLESKYW